MTTNAKVLETLLTPDKMAQEIVNFWNDWKGARSEWEEEVSEIRDFVYATDTRTTQVGQNDFANSTTVNKLAQIQANLKANYSAHLFSNPNWAQFEPYNLEEETLQQRQKVEAYVRTKFRRKNYEKVMRKCLDDWINSGVCFGQQTYVREFGVDVEGNKKVLYEGTELHRIHPNDIVFDVTASSWEKCGKVIRRTFTLGDIARDIEENPDSYFDEEMLEKMRTLRQYVNSAGVKKSATGIDYKSIGLTKSGLGDELNYIRSGLVEVHEYYGDLYSLEDGKFRKNHKVVVVDHKFIAHDAEITTENGSQKIYYSAWEERPDSLMGMSPLARIVGMQYKLDKLENLRADVFDQMAHPIVVEKGNVYLRGKRGEPGAKYIIDDADGDVRYLALPSEALNADFQIDNTMNIMEMMAGSPQNASGFRTPGEKTKFEVQILDGGTNRTFRDRVNQFETDFLEPVMRDCIALGRDNIGEVDMVSTSGSDFNVETFLAISSNDLFVSGKMRARGSRLFAERANALQNIINIFNTNAGQVVQPHVSSKKLAAALEELGEFKDFDLFFPFIAIQEQAEAQRLQQITAQSMQQNAAVTAADDEARDIEQTDLQGSEAVPPQEGDA